MDSHETIVNDTVETARVEDRVARLKVASDLSATRGSEVRDRGSSSRFSRSAAET
jgi:hypothetical protein